MSGPEWVEPRDRAPVVEPSSWWRGPTRRRTDLAAPAEPGVYEVKVLAGDVRPGDLVPGFGTVRSTETQGVFRPEPTMVRWFAVAVEGVGDLSGWRRADEYVTVRRPIA